VIILDANVLLISWDGTNQNHAKVNQWLEDLLNSEELIGLPWLTAWAFLRIGTSARLFARPIEPEEGFGVLRRLLSLPNVTIADPGQRHGEILEQLVDRHQVRGPKMTDAVLAAIAIEHGAALASTDEDFRRFPSLRWLNPLGLPGISAE
jgi:toxin-antitoxin system PIN domain toxin